MGHKAGIICHSHNLMNDVSAALQEKQAFWKSNHGQQGGNVFSPDLEYPRLKFKLLLKIEDAIFRRVPGNGTGWVRRDFRTASVAHVCV